MRTRSVREALQLALLLLMVAAIGLLLFGIFWILLSEAAGGIGGPTEIFLWLGGAAAVLCGVGAWLLRPTRPTQPR